MVEENKSSKKITLKRSDWKDADLLKFYCFILHNLLELDVKIDEEKPKIKYGVFGSAKIFHEFCSYYFKGNRSANSIKLFISKEKVYIMKLINIKEEIRDQLKCISNRKAQDIQSFIDPSSKSFYLDGDRKEKEVRKKGETLNIFPNKESERSIRLFLKKNYESKFGQVIIIKLKEKNDDWLEESLAIKLKNDRDILLYDKLMKYAKEELSNSNCDYSVYKMLSLINTRLDSDLKRTPEYVHLSGYYLRYVVSQIKKANLEKDSASEYLDLNWAEENFGNDDNLIERNWINNDY